jgi:tetratricopeptide (TPR) repeat protein
MIALTLLGAPVAHGHATHTALMAKVDENLSKEPENGGLWYRRGVLEFEHADWTSAAEDFAKAEKFAPGEFPTLLWQGRILDQQAKPAEAKTALDAFLAKTPDHWGALAARARVLAKLGENEKSLDDFRATLRHIPTADPDLIQEVATALAANDKVDEAIAVLESGLKDVGPVASLQLKILDVEADAARYDSALSRLAAIQAAAPRPEPWMEKRAAILAQAGRSEESRAAWQVLLSHLNSLPRAQRESHAMVLAAERARQAVAILSSAHHP